MFNWLRFQRQIHDAEAQPQAEAFAHRSLFDWQPQISSNAFDRNWYGIRPMVAFEDEPFFASNLVYYPELPQPFRVSPYQSYRDWKSYHDARRTMQVSEAVISPSLLEFVDVGSCWVYSRRRSQRKGRPTIAGR